MPGYKTHGVIGGGAGGTVGVATGEPVLAAVGIVLGALGGLLPDADHPDARISRMVPGLHKLVGLLPGGHRGATHWPVLAAALWLGARVVCLWRGWPVALANAAGWGYALHLAADALTVDGIPGVVRPWKRLHLLPRGLRPASGGRGEGVIRVMAGMGFLVVWATMLGVVGSKPGAPGAASQGRQGRTTGVLASSPPTMQGPVATAHGLTWPVSGPLNDYVIQPYRRADRWLTYAAFNWAWIARYGLDRPATVDAAGSGGSVGGSRAGAAIGRLMIWLDPSRWPIPAHTTPERESAVWRRVGPLPWDKRPYATILGLRAQTAWPVARDADTILLGEDGLIVAVIVGLVGLGALTRRRAGGARTRVTTVVRDLPEGARWATQDEVLAYAGPALTPFVVGRWVPRTGKGLGAAVGFDRPRGPLLTLPPSVATEGVKVTMPTGEGKSSDVIVGGATLAKRAYQAGGATRCGAPSGIYWDPAGELEKALAGAYALAGWQVVTLNPAPLDAGARARAARVNPFAWYDGPAWLDMYLRAWFETGHGSAGGSASQFYSDKARAVIAGLVVALRAARPQQPPTWPEIAEALAARAGEDDKAHQARIGALLASAGRDGGEGLTTWEKMAGIPDQFRNLKGELGARLAPLQEEAVRHMLSGNDVPLEALVTGRPGPVVVFIQVPSLRQEFYAPVTASLLVALMDAIGTAFLRTGAKGTGLFVELDEAGSGAAGAGKQPIFGLATMVTTLRKFGCMIRVFYQAGSQVESGYGAAQADTIGGNLKTWSISGGAVGDAAGIADRCGLRNVGTTTTTTTPPTAAERKRAREGGYTVEDKVRVGDEVVSHPALVTPTLVQQIPKWRRMVVGSRGYPFVVESIHPSQIKEVAAWTGLPRSDPPRSGRSGRAVGPPPAAAAMSPTPAPAPVPPPSSVSPVSAPPEGQALPATRGGGGGTQPLMPTAPPAARPRPVAGDDFW